MRRAARTDENQARIVDALRAVGCSVDFWGRLDLIVGFRGANFLLEVKNRQTGYGRRGLNSNQRRWAATWQGQHAVVKDEAEALAAVGVRAVRRQSVVDDGEVVAYVTGGVAGGPRR